ncbi:MAG: hypothetical protein ABR925_06405 [Acidimicrobiales bacterium]|jgi:hypothetical protein
MRAPILLVSLTAAIAFAAGCGSSTSSGNAPNGMQAKSGDQIVAAAVKAAKHESSLHFVETTAQGTARVSIVGDVGTSSGEQRITLREGAEVGHLTLLLTHGTAYFEGNTVGLEGFTGLSATLSAEFAERWISVPSTSTDFSQIADSLTVKSATTEFVKLPGTLTRGKTSTEKGSPVVAVTAFQKSKSGTLRLTMYVATTGAVLPVVVEGTTTATGSTPRSVNAVFSDWGAVLHLAAPVSSIPIAELEALAEKG